MRPAPTLIACCLVAVALGSVHAFSVLLQALQDRLQVDRSTVSLGYSLALVAITAAVFAGPHVYGKAPARLLLFLSCLFGAIGLALTALVQTPIGLWLGFGVLFGAGNGLGYGYALQQAGQTLPGREGLTMGLVTAAYGLGGAICAVPLSVVNTAHGPFVALLALSGVVLLAGAIAAGFASLGRAGTLDATKTAATRVRPIVLWVAYFGAVLAGLMAIGHATEIVQEIQPLKLLWLAPVLFAVTNAAASVTGGALSDRMNPRALLAGLAMGSACALVLLSFTSLGSVAVVLMAGIGGVYGATISIYPAIIAKRFGPEGPAVYGRMFTAWGVAGLLGPWLAGAVFDATGTYTAALLLAAAFAMVSAVVTALAV